MSWISRETDRQRDRPKDWKTCIIGSYQRAGTTCRRPSPSSMLQASEITIHSHGLHLLAAICWRSTMSFGRSLALSQNKFTRPPSPKEPEKSDEPEPSSRPKRQANVYDAVAG